MHYVPYSSYDSNGIREKIRENPTNPLPYCHFQAAGAPLNSPKFSANFSFPGTSRNLPNYSANFHGFIFSKPWNAFRYFKSVTKILDFWCFSDSKSCCAATGFPIFCSCFLFLFWISLLNPGYIPVLLTLFSARTEPSRASENTWKAQFVPAITL